MSDDGVSSSANTLFTLDTPGAAGPAGSYCEVHGYVQAKEADVIPQFRVLSHLCMRDGARMVGSRIAINDESYECIRGARPAGFEETKSSNPTNVPVRIASTPDAVLGHDPLHFWHSSKRNNASVSHPIGTRDR
ncbi:hypothetical protein ALC57_09608 [Trachymyrmex cornetzi]|uniref:Uncharacterized protein n=1 Tax=Trachymyrmex cornetzi TaxID=471704 RepID=A0A195DYY0_9HYME|nr:hypothetical protein ALC57_09608 [Trachymyrmex cornetzi]